MRIRLTTILFAAGGYLIGSGKAQQLWSQAQRFIEDRRPTTADRPLAAAATNPYDSDRLTASPVESFST